MVDEHDEIVTRLVDSGLDVKEARVVVALANEPPAKASDIGKQVGITRMDAYNTLRRLQERGLVRATVDKPMRFVGQPIEEVFRHLIHREEQELRRLEGHLKALREEMPEQIRANPTVATEPTFTVLKDRHNIYAAMERLTRDAERTIWLLLGRYGVLHFVKTGALAAINEQAEAGVPIHVIADIERRTLRFFDQLSDKVEIRHSDQLDVHGCVVDEEVLVQAVVMDPNPVGRGREDAALVVEAPEFIETQLGLIRAAWGSATSIDSVRSRIIEGRIVEPLRVSLGEGSFYHRFKEVLARDASAIHPHPEGWVNAIMRRPGEPITREFSLSPMQALGIDTNQVMRAVGERIGEELALELDTITEDAAFLEELRHRWEQLGLGELEVTTSPGMSVRVKDGGSCGGSPSLGLPFCHLDEGILTGVLAARFGVEAIASRRKCSSPDDPHCSFDVSFAVEDTEPLLAE